MSDGAAVRNALEQAIDRTAEAFGSPGKAALRMFLDSLPADAAITWGDEPQWASAAMVAMQLREELANG